MNQTATDRKPVSDPAQLLVWLDEQRREDRRQLAELSELAEAQSQEIQELAQRFEGLERRLVNTQGQLIKFAELEGALQELKNEIMGVLDENRTKLQQRDAQLESRIEAQDPKLATISRALEDVQGGLSALENQVQALPARIDEQNKQAATLSRDIEDLEKRFNQTRAQLAQLNQRLANQGDSMTTLAKQLENLEGRLSNTRAQLVKFSQIEAAIQETRDELVFMIKEIEEQRQKEAREAAEIRESEIKDLRVAIDLIRRELEPIPQLEERIKTLATEDERLRDLITQQEVKFPPLNEAIREHRERISYLEEDRPKTTRRIDELEVEIPKLYREIEETASKIPFLEEWAQRSAEQIDELKRFEDQMEQWRAGFIEEIRRGEKHRDRRLTDWEKVLDEHAEIIEQWRETLRRYELSHLDSRRTLKEVEALGERLERDQAEVAEQQRLADERLQRELEAWQQENEKRWRLFLKKRDYDWEQQEKRDSEQDQRFEPLEAWRREHAERFEEELDRLDENDRRTLRRFVKLVRYLEEIVEQQIVQRKQQRDRLEEEQIPDDLLIGRSPGRHRRGG